MYISKDFQSFSVWFVIYIFLNGVYIWCWVSCSIWWLFYFYYYCAIGSFQWFYCVLASHILSYCKKSLWFNGSSTLPSIHSYFEWNTTYQTSHNEGGAFWEDSSKRTIQNRQNGCSVSDNSWHQVSTAKTDSSHSPVLLLHYTLF